MAKLKLGEFLIQAGLIDAEQLANALMHQKRWNRKLGRCLLDLGFIKEKTLYESLSKSLNIPVIDLSRIRPETITEKLLKCIPAKVATETKIIPLSIQRIQNRDRLIIGASDPLNYDALRAARLSSPLPLFVMIAPESDIDWFIRRYYYRGRGNKDYISIAKMKGIGRNAENIHIVESIFEDSLFDSNTKIYRPKKD